MPPRKFWGSLLVAALCGCGREAETRPDTGARRCVQEVFETIVRQDWQAGYAALDARSQKLYTQRQFGQLAQAYRTGLDFEPAAVQVQFCAEEGDQATARVVLTGQTEKRMHR